jgi:hypothetical protein
MSPDRSSAKVGGFGGKCRRIIMRRSASATTGCSTRIDREGVPSATPTASLTGSLPSNSKLHFNTSKSAILLSIFGDVLTLLWRAVSSSDKQSTVW